MAALDRMHARSAVRVQGRVRGKIVAGIVAAVGWPAHYRAHRVVTGLVSRFDVVGYLQPNPSQPALCLERPQLSADFARAFAVDARPSQRHLQVSHEGSSLSHQGRDRSIKGVFSQRREGFRVPARTVIRAHAHVQGKYKPLPRSQRGREARSVRGCEHSQFFTAGDEAMELLACRSSQYGFSLAAHWPRAFLVVLLEPVSTSHAQQTLSYGPDAATGPSPTQNNAYLERRPSSSAQGELGCLPLGELRCNAWRGCSASI